MGCIGPEAGSVLQTCVTKANTVASGEHRVMHRRTAHDPLEKKNLGTKNHHEQGFWIALDGAPTETTYCDDHWLLIPKHFMPQSASHDPRTQLRRCTRKRPGRISPPWLCRLNSCGGGITHVRARS